MLLACTVAVPLLAAAVAVRARGKRAAAVAEVGAVAGTVPWLWMILTPLPQHGEVHPVPFQEVPGYLVVPVSEAIVQIGGNLAVAAAAGSVLVETLQWALDLGRVSSVDDVLPNTLGAVLAALVTRRWWRTESLVGAKRCRSHPV